MNAVAGLKFDTIGQHYTEVQFEFGQFIDFTGISLLSMRQYFRSTRFISLTDDRRYDIVTFDHRYLLVFVQCSI